MEYRRTREIIEHARDFHGRLEARYRELSGRAEQQRVKLLLDYLGRHEARLREELGRFEQHTAREILDSWFQYVPEEDTLQRFNTIALTPDMTIDQVVTMALTLDQYLVDLYRESAGRALSNDVREIFRNLLQLEKDEQLRLKRSALDAELL